MEHTDYIIRPVVEGDSAGIAAILRETGWFGFLNTEPADATHRRVARNIGLCSANDSHDVMVAESPADGVIGYAAVHWLPYIMGSGPEGFISDLFIREPFRGKGVGTRLLEEIKRIAENRGSPKLLLTTARDRDAYGKGFYKSKGWMERSGHAIFMYPINMG